MLVISDGDLVLAESGAIVEYLCRRHAGGCFILAAENAHFTHYLYWFHFGNGSIIPSLMLDVVTRNSATASRDSGSGASDSRTEGGLNMIEDCLSRANFFAGDEFTAAEVMMCEMQVFAKREMKSYPNVKAYLQRLGQRPGCRRAMRKSEPDRPVPA